MYDPFAAPPPPGTYQAQQNQAMPNPQPNNALAALYNKHMVNLTGGVPGMGGYGNGGPVATGQPIPGPNTQFPLNPGMGGHGQQDWRQAFDQARMDWRGDRPTFGGGDWRTQMGDWRQQRPNKQDYRMGTVPTAGA